MIATWMMYHIGIVALLGLAATVLEDVAQRYRVGSRWLWAGALMGSLAIPAGLVLIRVFWPNGSAIAAVQLGRITVVGAEPGQESVLSRSIEQAESLGLGDLNAMLVALWVAATILLLFYLANSMLQLREARRGWIEAEVHGEKVLLAEGAGPAVVGMRRPRIVFPRWALSLPEAEQRMMLAHEREHIRAGDTRLLAVAYAAVAALPWNLPLWFVARRLRDAIEYDCDRRVLKRNGDVESYGSLLLEVGLRPTELPTGVAAFSRGRSQLERRLRAMTKVGGRYRTGTALVGTLAAVALVMVACSMDPPAQADGAVTESDTPAGATALLESETPIRTAQVTEPEPATEPTSQQPPAEAPRENSPDPAVLRSSQPEQPSLPPSGPPPTTEEAGDEPAFVPMEVRPSLRNGSELAGALQRNYPSMLRDAGIEATTTLWVRLSTSGEVDDVRVFESSGYPQFDEVAVQTMLNDARFSPARNRDQPVGVWIQIPVVFQIAR